MTVTVTTPSGPIRGPAGQLTGPPPEIIPQGPPGTGGGAGGAVASVNGRTGAVTLSKTDVALSNVDNTADASKPVSTAQAAADAVVASAASAALAAHVVAADPHTQYALESSLASVATTGAYADLSGKPTLGTAAALNVAAAGDAASGEVVKGNDTRLSDARTPTNLTGPVTSTGNATAIANGTITNAMLANSAVANLSNTNTGDNAVNSLYSGLAASKADKGAATASGLTVAANNVVLSRGPAGTGDIEENPVSTVLDFIGSVVQGDILYRDASSWARLAAATAGYYLKSNGAGANPSWALVNSALLTGYVSGAGTVAAGDTILQGINKLNGNIALKAATGAVTGTGITMSTARLLGRSTASTGAIEEITLGTNLSFTGTTLNAAGGGGSPGGSSGAVQGNTSSGFAGIPGFTYDTTSGVLDIATGTITTSQPAVVVRQTFNAGAVAFVGKSNEFTHTASASTTLLERWREASTNVVEIRKGGKFAFTNELRSLDNTCNVYTTDGLICNLSFATTFYKNLTLSKSSAVVTGDGASAAIGYAPLTVQGGNCGNGQDGVTSLTLHGGNAAPNATTNITGGITILRGGNGASGSAGAAHGGPVHIHGGLPYGTGVAGAVNLAYTGSAAQGLIKSWGHHTFDAAVIFKAVTVGTLPTASAVPYGTYSVTDSLAPVAGATVAAGGSAKATVQSNGTNWIVLGTL